MLLIVEPQTPNSLDIFSGQWRKQESNISHLIRHVVLPKDLPLDDLGLLGFCNIGRSLGKDGISIVCSTILCEESDKSLGR